MNKRIIFISLVLVLFSLIICQGERRRETSIYKNLFTNFSTIEENGVKVQYSINNSIFEECKKLCTSFNIDFKAEEIKKNDGVYYFNKIIVSGSRQTKLTVENEGQDTVVEIEIVENTKKVIVDDLKKELAKLVDDTFIKVQYFSYVKGNLNTQKQVSEINDYLQQKLKENGATKVNSIPINSGVTGVASNNRDFRFNYSICEYNSGKYLIVGTPTIFTTY